jgi:hypothetical protein
VDFEDIAFCFFIRQRELNLSVDTARADEGRVKGLDLVSRHDYFNIGTSVKPIKLSK